MSDTLGLKVHENKRFLQKEDMSPFFYLGDTAWELFHKLDRDEAKLYLEDRAEKGFNVVQAVALAERDGLNIPNQYGRIPLHRDETDFFDPASPDVDGEYSYWDHMEYIIELADSLGIYIVLLPTWGDKFTPDLGIGPAIFNSENAYEYGKFIGNRYKKHKNIIWCLGGDRVLITLEHHEIVGEMVRGIKSSGADQLMTLHPRGESSSSLYVHSLDWMDFNMIQTGHGKVARDVVSFIENDYKLMPTKPTINGEPLYEDIPIRFDGVNGFYDDFDVRIAAYRSVFSGALGHTYGNNSVWAMIDGDEIGEFFIMSWRDALDRPGASHMQHLKNLMLSYDFFSRTPANSIITNNYEGELKLCATQGENYFMVHDPYGLPICINEWYLGDRYVAKWYDPKTGEYSEGFQIPKIKVPKEKTKWTEISFLRASDYTQEMVATPVKKGKHNDVVLVVKLDPRPMEEF